MTDDPVCLILGGDAHPHGLRGLLHRALIPLGGGIGRIERCPQFPKGLLLPVKGRLENSRAVRRRFLSPVDLLERRFARLAELGLMAAEPDGSFASITPNGLRALADAADAGRVTLFVMPERIKGC